MSRFLFLLLFLQSILSFGQELITYQVPKELFYSAHNDDFTVNVRTPGGEWQDLYEYKVKVDMDTHSTASMVSFDFKGKVQVRVRINNGLAYHVKVRPQNVKIKTPRYENNTVYFMIEKPTKLSLEVNGDKLHNLHIFANAIQKNVPKEGDPGVIYFGPGLHKMDTLADKTFSIPSNKTVFLHGGAVINGKLLVDSAENVKILGHGIVFEPERGVELRYAKNVTIDGPIFINPKHYTIFGGQATNLNINNIKTFSDRGWSDGIDLMSCNDVKINDVFLRNSDDCIAIYGHRWDFYGSSRNITVSNSILWADIAHATNIGTHGDADRGGDTIEYVTFKNIDILEHDEDDRNYQGCMAISASDNNVVKNITYQNIRIDDIQEGQVFNFRVFYNEKYCKAPGRAIENIRLEDIRYNGFTAYPSIIAGYDEERKVKNIYVDNWRVWRKNVKSTDSPEMEVGDFVENIRIKH